ncbi:MAG: hypothetical protein QOJ65_750 [Fimbriimonadaceae bacterium]|jgi:ankyrin repeat protein|nr:hypothetical protein [Fimbriimonadaceae bacterium]
MSKSRKNPSLIAAYIGAAATLFSAAVAIMPKPSCERPKETSVMVDAKDPNNWTPLYRAARSNNETAVQRLLAQGADPNAADSHGWTPIFHAARFGNSEMTRALLSKGAAVDIQSDMKETPLHLAAANGDLDTIRALAVGKDGSPIVNVNVEDSHADRPLHYAARKGRAEAVKLLIGLGAEDSKDDQGHTAMDLASNNDVKDELRKILPKKGRGNPLKIRL